MSVDANRTETLRRLSKSLKYHYDRVARGDVPFFFVCNATKENTILGCLEGEAGPVHQVRDRRDVRLVECVGAYEMARIMEAAQTLLTQEKTKTQRYVMHVHLQLVSLTINCVCLECCIMRMMISSKMKLSVAEGCTTWRSCSMFQSLHLVLHATQLVWLLECCKSGCSIIFD
jgi:hypothetical protein